MAEFQCPCGYETDDPTVIRGLNAKFGFVDALKEGEPWPYPLIPPPHYMLEKVRDPDGDEYLVACPRCDQQVGVPSEFGRVVEKLLKEKQQVLHEERDRATYERLKKRFEPGAT